MDTVSTEYECMQCGVLYPDEPVYFHVCDIVDVFPSASIRDHSNDDTEPGNDTKLCPVISYASSIPELDRARTAAGMMTMSSQPQCRSFLKNLNPNRLPVMPKTSKIATHIAVTRRGP